MKNSVELRNILESQLDYVLKMDKPGVDRLINRTFTREELRTPFGIVTLYKRRFFSETVRKNV